MKKIIILLCLVLLMTGCTKTSDEPTNESNENATENINTEDKKMQIEVKGNGKMFVSELNDSQAAKDLYAQLPLSMEVENFSTNEKVFYPPQKLNTQNTPLANADIGTLAYYSPWGDVVMFYDYFGKGGQLYELGLAISGQESIELLSGTIVITIKE